jgi:hypothetical protein
LELDLLARGAIQGNMMIYGALGCASGLLTDPLRSKFQTILAGDSLSAATVFGVPLDLFLSGIAFAVAVFAALVYSYRFNPRQLFILLFVLLGWFLALKTYMVLSPEVELGGQVANVIADEDLLSRCEQFNATEDSLKTNESASSFGQPNKDGDSAKACQYLAQAQSSANFITLLKAYSVAGAIGALVTALGVPLATRRSISLVSIALIILAGAAIALAWAYFLEGQKNNPYAPFELFVPWQAIVAAMIGRSIK